MAEHAMAAAHARTRSRPSEPGRHRRFRRGVRGSASVELAIGVFVLISIAMLAFDLYSLVKADAAGARLAVTMANYASFETAPDGDELEALGSYLREHDLGIPAALVYVISTVHQPPGGDPAVVLWDDDSIRLGDDEATASLAEECRRRAGEAWRDKLVDEGPQRFALNADEVIWVVEVCARLLRQGTFTSRFIAGDIYHLHAAPARDMTRTPERPTRVSGRKRRRDHRPPERRPEARRGGRRHGGPPMHRNRERGKTLPADATAPARLAGNPSTIHRSN